MTDWPTMRTRMQEAQQRRLGEPMTYTPVAGAPVVATGIFVNEANRPEVDGIVLSTNAPMILIHIADLSGAAIGVGATVDVRSTSYRVESFHPDGEGDVLFVMSEI